MIIITIIKIFLISLTTPINAVKKFSFKKIQVLIYALRNESSQQIINNFKRYILGGECNQPNEIEITDLPSLKDKFYIEKNQLFNVFIQSGSLLTLPNKKPILSIILVFYNKVGLSFACIQSIIKNVSISYELIIVDNNSTDNTSILLDRIRGAHIIRNSENVHFLKANNQALKFVRGEFLLFLNNDTEITETTIQSSINTLTGTAKCGAVGGKLILPGGLLQEAGSIIWKDGSCLGYGRNENPNNPEFNFKRITDYCSGAFLLTKTNLFKDHGGFDNCFNPAYYEETDYCLWLQERGLHVIYDPNSVVYHFEFGSGVQDTAFSLHQTNQQIFFKKHLNQLNYHSEPDFSNILNARFAASQRGRKKILYIDDRVPHRDLGSGFPRSNIIAELINKLGFDITIYPLNFPNEDNWETAYRDIDPFIEIALGYGLDGFDRFIKLRENYFDYIWVSRPHNIDAIGKKINFLKGKCKIIYDAEAIFTDREILRMQLNGSCPNQGKIDSMYRSEFELLKLADIVVAVSEKDALKFREYGKSNVHVLGHALKISESSNQFSDRKGLLFVGNLDYNNSPNVDSVNWFVKEILPIIEKTIPDIEFHIVGSAQSSLIKSINKRNVFIHGKVESTSKFYNQCRVYIAPTRYAAGIPFKIHEAASFGLPTVASQLLCNQLDWTNRNLMVSSQNDKFEFAEGVIKLYTDSLLWSEIRKNLTIEIEKNHSINTFSCKLATILGIGKN